MSCDCKPCWWIHCHRLHVVQPRQTLDESLASGPLFWKITEGQPLGNISSPWNLTMLKHSMAISIWMKYTYIYIYIQYVRYYTCINIDKYVPIYLPHIYIYTDVYTKRVVKSSLQTRLTWFHTQYRRCKPLMSLELRYLILMSPLFWWLWR